MNAMILLVTRVEGSRWICSKAIRTARARANACSLRRFTGVSRLGRHGDRFSLDQRPVEAFAGEFGRRMDIGCGRVRSQFAAGGRQASQIRLGDLPFDVEVPFFGRQGFRRPFGDRGRCRRLFGGIPGRRLLLGAEDPEGVQSGKPRLPFPEDVDCCGRPRLEIAARGPVGLLALPAQRPFCGFGRRDPDDAPTLELQDVALLVVEVEDGPHAPLPPDSQGLGAAGLTGPQGLDLDDPGDEQGEPRPGGDRAEDILEPAKSGGIGHADRFDMRLSKRRE